MPNSFVYFLGVTKYFIESNYRVRHLIVIDSWNKIIFYMFG